MSKWMALVLAMASAGCLIPQFLLSETEVIRPADSTAVFGPRGEVRIPGLQETARVAWDSKERTYLPFPAGSDSEYAGLRVARLRGDAFLFQATLTEDDELGPGYLLVLVRMSAAGDATPLGCDITAATAARFGVVISPHDPLSELVHKADGRRADIIEMLRAQLPGCLPLMRFDNFAPPAGELVAPRPPQGAAGSALAVRAQKAGCRPCPSGACLAGKVTDQQDSTIPGVGVSLRDSAGRSLATAKTDRNGRFLISGAPPGNHRLVVELSGFVPKWPAKALSMQPGGSYAFEMPITLRVGFDAGEADPALIPFECPAN